MTDKKYKNLLLLAISGILTGVTVILPQVGFFEWITLAPAALFLLIEASNRERKLRSLYGYGLFFFLMFYMVGFHWFISLYPLDFIGGMTPPAAIAVVLAGCVGLSLLQALFGGLLFVATGLLFRTKLLSKRGFLKPVLLALTWAVYEWTQTLGWWGVPWSRLPLGQSKYIVGLQTASLFGSYFVTFALVAVNALLAYAFLNRDKIVSIKYSAIVAAAILVLQYGAGAVIYFANTEESAESVRIAAIQGNISSKDKWDFSTFERTMDIYEDYTLKAVGDGAKIVVWPETVIPNTIDRVTHKRISQLASENNVIILVGAFCESESLDGEYNSVFCYLSDGSVHEQVYSKRRLVPFGEFVPMRPIVDVLIPPLADLIMSGGDILWGEDEAIMDTEYGNIGSLICFDSIYEELSRSSTHAGADVLCLSTNDSWFGDSAGVYMHNAQSQLRAIENGRYVVRSANTGISTIIDEKGRVLESLDPLVDGYIVGDVKLCESTTLYTAIGNAFIYLGIAVYAVIVVGDVAIKLRERSKNKK